jgi:hypothetical protein
MSILLADLVTELQGKVPARNGVPSAAQYAKTVKEAVSDFSLHCSREKINTLVIVSGTATYALPADFIRLIRLYSGFEIDGVLVTAQGLIPQGGLAMTYERYTFANGQITIYPVPAYSLTRTLRYAAGWALTSGTTYADLTESEAEIALLKAQAACLTLQLNAEGGGVLAYRIGDESFDKSGGVQTMTTNRDARLAEYKAAMEAYNGALTLYGGCG